MPICHACCCRNEKVCVYLPEDDLYVTELRPSRKTPSSAYKASTVIRVSSPSVYIMNFSRLFCVLCASSPALIIVRLAGIPIFKKGTEGSELHLAQQCSECFPRHDPTQCSLSLFAVYSVGFIRTLGSLVIKRPLEEREYPTLMDGWPIRRGLPLSYIS